MLVVGTCGCVGSDETLACFIAGSFLNWDGVYNSEMQARHDTFNPTLETLLNFGTISYAPRHWDHTSATIRLGLFDSSPSSDPNNPPWIPIHTCRLP